MSLPIILIYKILDIFSYLSTILGNFIKVKEVFIDFDFVIQKK